MNADDFTFGRSRLNFAPSPAPVADDVWNWTDDDAATPRGPGFWTLIDAPEKGDAATQEFFDELTAEVTAAERARRETEQRDAAKKAELAAASAPLAIEAIRRGALPPTWSRVWPREVAIETIVEQLRAEGYSSTGIIECLLCQARWPQNVIANAVGMSPARITAANQKLREKAMRDPELARALPDSVMNPKQFAALMRQARERDDAERIKKVRRGDVDPDTDFEEDSDHDE